MKEKTCRKCLEVKPVECFNKKSGEGVQPYCRECDNNAAKERYQAKKGTYIARRETRRQALAAKVRKLKEVPCADCGKEYPYYVMDFDHVRGDKAGNVSSMISNKDNKKILEEVAKCEVVCANCHRERTQRRMLGIV